MHRNQIVVSDEVARHLIRTQFPQWADARVRRIITSGTVNAIFRIGQGYTARFPLLGTDPAGMQQVLDSEAKAAAEFATVSPFPSPIPSGLGRPGEGFSLPWSVQSWLDGVDANEEDAGASEALAHDLAQLINSLRTADTRGRSFSGVGRGGILRDHDPWIQECLRRSTGLLDVPHLAGMWQDFLVLPRTSQDVMSHGDLTPANLLVANGHLSGVLDCGGFGPADPALDVVAAWTVLDRGPRELFRAELGCDDLEWERSKAWAFQQALGAIWYYSDSNPAMALLGRRSLQRIMEAELH